VQLSPIVAKRDGREVVVNAGKMGYVYAMDAASGRLLWNTRVGAHNGHDRDGELALAHRLSVPRSTSRWNPASSAVSRPTWRSPTA